MRSAPQVDSVPESSLFEQLAERSAKLRELCEQLGVVRLSMFGSALGKDFDPARSDVDFAVDFDSDREPGAQEYFDFQSGLADLVGREVDLVELRVMADSRLKQSILGSLRTIYSKDDPAPQHRGMQ